MKLTSHGDIVYNIVSIVNNTLTYVKVAMRVNLKSSYQKKKNVTMYSEKC